MPLTLDFFEQVKVLDKNWSMGVELASPFIYSLIRLTRPRKVLEVGAGYSSLFILQALADNLGDYNQNKKLMEGQVRLDEHVGLKRVVRGKGLLRRHPLPLALPDYYKAEYNPHLSIIDNVSHAASSAGHVRDVAKKLNLDSLLQFHEGDFRGLSKSFGQELLPFDFVWFDCGSLREYTDFLEEYWNLVNRDGGLFTASLDFNEFAN